MEKKTILFVDDEPNILSGLKRMLRSMRKTMNFQFAENGQAALEIMASEKIDVSGIKGFRAMLDYCEQNTPLRRNVTIDEVGNVAAFLCSDLASGITGEITYVDGGYNITGMGQLSK